ncbi:MAG: zinc-ribbon domain-containing protein [Firmicutes bacterium]|nr:zinc-ribbon domain-containing protein [Bacillota bacterium]
MAELQDKTLNCKDCSNDFVFTAGEQEFYNEKGFTNEPQRCPECRKAKKQSFRDNRNRDRN